MPCKCQEQRPIEEKRVGICDVCRLVKNDTAPKPVQYCHVCNAWICDVCRVDWVARAKAALISHSKTRGRSTA
jgi:hypothetical protein